MVDIIFLAGFFNTLIGHILSWDFRKTGDIGSGTGSFLRVRIVVASRLDGREAGLREVEDLTIDALCPQSWRTQCELGYVLLPFLYARLVSTTVSKILGTT